MNKVLSLLVCVVALAIAAPVSAGEDDAALKQRLLKLADKSAAELFDGSFDPKDSKVLRAAGIPGALKTLGVDPRTLPAAAKAGLQDKSIVALFVSRMKIPQRSVTKKMDEPPMLMMAWEDFRYEAMTDGVSGAGGFWVGGESMTKPCPGGTDFCQRCTGCMGPKNFCICTNSCSCKPCLSCGTSGEQPAR